MNAAVAWGGFAVGIGFGMVGRWSGFCLLRGLRGWWGDGDTGPIRAFALALAVALLGTQALQAAGAVDLTQSVYVRPAFAPLAVFLGGAVFGLGMVLANSCGARALVLLGGGNLRSFVVLACLGIAGYATLSGVLAPLRGLVAGSLVITTGGSATVPDVLAAAGLPGLAATWLPTLLPAGLLAAFALRGGGHARQLVGGAAIGALVVAGWVVTGVLGADDFDPAPLASLSFIIPVGNAFLYAMLATGKAVDFGAALVAGVAIGALAVALAGRGFRLEGFTTPAALLRAMGGGALMGIGGVLAAGCSIGQGLTGLSTLALAAIPAAAGILAGAALGLKGFGLRGPDASSTRITMEARP